MLGPEITCTLTRPDDFGILLAMTDRVSGDLDVRSHMPCESEQSGRVQSATQGEGDSLTSGQLIGDYQLHSLAEGARRFRKRLRRCPALLHPISWPFAGLARSHFEYSCAL